jgi:hypothetical protein
MGDPVNIADIRTLKRRDWGAPVLGGSQVEVLDIETATPPLNITKNMQGRLAYWLTQAEKPTHIVRVRDPDATIAWAFLVAPSPATPFALIPQVSEKWFPRNSSDPLVAEANILAEAEKIAQSREYRTIKVRAHRRGEAKFKKLGYTFEADLGWELFLFTKDLPPLPPPPKPKRVSVDGDPAQVPPSNFQPTPGDPQGGKRKSRRKSRRKPRRKTRKT